MSRFEECLVHVLESEGGWTDDPDDLGGKTNKGITIADYSEYRGLPITTDLIRDLRNISDDEVRDLYNLHYWLKVRADVLPPGIDYATFDFGVNSGVGTSKRILQETVKTRADGRIGPLTLKAIAEYPKREYPNQSLLVERFIDARMIYLKTRPTFWKHGKGWFNRCDKVRRIALQMIADSKGS